MLGSLIWGLPDTGSLKIIMKLAAPLDIWLHKYCLDKITHSVLISMLSGSLLMSCLWVEGRITAETVKLSEKKCQVVRPKFLLVICQRYQNKVWTLSIRQICFYSDVAKNFKEEIGVQWYQLDFDASLAFSQIRTEGLLSRKKTQQSYYPS